MTFSAASLVREVGGPFDLIGGLPVHPLIVHVAIVVLPVAALALIVVMALPRMHRLVRWGVVAALAVGALAAWIAAESGEALSERVGEAEVHEELGENLPLIAGITLALAVVWAVVAELSARASRVAATTGAAPSRVWLALRIAVSVVTASMAAYAIYSTVIVGHSGAVATWLGRVGG
ncbi:hypothetical protein [Microcella sp.]|uniref:hypothetical protein n=1 Tax=Microcella sp. TaxID=1913979 RepID=UPI003F6F20F1